MIKSGENHARLFSILLSLLTSVLCAVSLSQGSRLYRVGSLFQSPLHLLCFAGELGRCRLYTRFLNPSSNELVITKDSLSGRKKQPTKIKELLKSSALIVSSVFIFAFLCIVLGAPALAMHAETLSLAALLTILCVFPLVQFLGVQKAVQVLRSGSDLGFVNRMDVGYVDMCRISAAGVLFGAWAGSIAYPLDWDRSWQAFPIPNVVGAIAGLAAANLLQLLALSLGQLKERLHSALGINN